MTTGPPKGAILTHANLVADISAYRIAMRQVCICTCAQIVQLLSHFKLDHEVPSPSTPYTPYPTYNLHPLRSLFIHAPIENMNALTLCKVVPFFVLFRLSFQANGLQFCLNTLFRDLDTFCGIYKHWETSVTDVFLFLSSQTGFELTSEDVHLSFLPLAHMYERINHVSI